MGEYEMWNCTLIMQGHNMPTYFVLKTYLLKRTLQSIVPVLKYKIR